MGGRGGSYERYSHYQDAYSFFGVGTTDGAYPIWERSITSEEKEEIVKYTGSDYRSINSALRDADKGYEKANMFMQRRIDRIDQAIAKFELKKNLKVYRGSSARLVGGYTTAAEINAYMKGAIVQDKGFISTSAVHGSQFSGKIKYEIQVPRGKGRGAFVSPISNFKTENEFLLKRGTYFKVAGATTDSSGATVVKLKVIDYRSK